MANWNPTSGGPETSRRRSQRVVVSVAITVFSQGVSREPSFEEQTHTLVVNAHGSLIALTAKVEKGQTLRILNRATHEEQLCKVMYVGPVADHKAQVGVEFTTPSPNFWRIAFPPEDWVTPAPDPPYVAAKKK
jgi:hypothetical protein